ncbi:NUDIX domain-containing protein [Candidatus Poribacteria bacterium]|nr:NUDIX domain-containing protein [Candidatus Poribacteria bacterium]
MKINADLDLPFEKVTAFITQKRNGVDSLLVFKHPNAGIQIPAGSVEVGEAIEKAAIREAQEETGLKELMCQQYLGCIENELDEQERLISESTEVYIKPDQNAITFKDKLTRGLTVIFHSSTTDFTHVTYFEYDQFPNPSYIAYNVSGWVPNGCINNQKKRHFFLLSTTDETEDRWELKSDMNHIFQPFWIPISPKPDIVYPQNRWLDFVYEKILSYRHES